MTLVRIFDPYAMALSFLVGGVGFGMTFFFNTNVPGWGMHEIGYPAMAMIYVYIRNARFFESDDKTNEALLEGNTATTTTATTTTSGAGDNAKDQKIPAPPANVRGLVLVAGEPLKAPAEGSLCVVFFFATWCANSERCLPSILSVASRYQDEGVTFAGVTQEPEDDLRYFVETYQRPLRSVTLLADQEGALTEGYQGAHRTKTIPHCYVVRGGTGDGFGVVEWHGHPTRLEQALIYSLDTAAEEAEEAEARGGGGASEGAQAEVSVAVPVG